MKLWEVKHRYYCTEENFYSNDCHRHHKSWQDFMVCWGQSEPDLNLLFRWDWIFPTAGDDYSEFPVPVWAGDENYPDSTLQTFWVLQRLGVFMCHEVDVCRADEPEIRKWLEGRMKHLLELWEPLTSEE